MDIYERSYSSFRKLKVYSRIPLEEKHLPNAIGNKAQSLFALDEYGFAVPDAVVLDFTFFENFQHTQKIPEELIVKIKNENLSDHLAIRSSCSLEDNFNESYAGAFETVLNVCTDGNDIIQALEKCYRSLPNLLQNNQSQKNHKNNNEACMGIIIQQMIPPKISGIIFTCSPINADENVYLIEYCSGEGDKLTGSQLSGDSFTIDKATGKIIQQTETIFIPQGQINNLRNLAKGIEGVFDFPQDVEFVISQTNDEIFLVQSRPITAFEYTPEYVIKQEKEKLETIFQTGKEKYGLAPVLSSSNISELFPIAIPLGYSIFKTIFAGTQDETGAWTKGRIQLGYAPLEKDEQPNLFITVGNLARADQLIHALTYRLEGIDKKYYLSKFVDHYMDTVRKNPEKSNYVQLGVYIQNPSEELCHFLFSEQGEKIYQIYRRFNANILFNKIPHIIKSISGILKINSNFFNRYVTDANHKNNKEEKWFSYDDYGYLKLSQSFSYTELVTKLNKLMNYLTYFLGTKYVIIARIAFLSSDIVKNILEKLILKFPELFISNHVKKLDKNDTESIEFYFNTLLENENFRYKYRVPDHIQYFKNLKLETTELKIFRIVYGHTGPLDLSKERLGEKDNGMLLDLLCSQAVPKKESNGKLNKEWIAKFYKKYKKMERALPDDLKNFRLWLQYARAFLEFRELMKYELLKILYLIKIVVKEISCQLQFGDLIYYLNYEDILKLAANPNKCRLEALKKKAYFSTCKYIEVADVLMENNDSNISLKNYVPESNGIYKNVIGETIHHGNAEGFCLIARDPDEFYRKMIEYRRAGIANIIGIFYSVEPGYFNLQELKGIITEHGGQLAHAATICRENNIPFITKIKIDLFQDRQYIIFDTAKNQVIYRE